MRVLGFPVHVRPGFLLFMLLIVFLYGDEFGIWLAGSIAVFTLLHELGHAVAARRAGARAEISLDFLAGYASYSSPRPLSRGAEAVIALAGPLTHIVASLGVLFAMGVDPLDAASRGSSAASAAVWWAGPVIGAFNLLPVLPLDGGNVVTSMLERVLPGRARSVMVHASVAATALAAVIFAMIAETRGFVVFLGLLLVMQLQALFAERDRVAASPFDDAAAALAKGNESKARRILVKGMQRPSPRRVAPRELDGDTARRLLALLPRPLPEGEPWNEYVLTNLLVRNGDLREAATYGAESYGRNPQPMLAATVARAAGGLGDDDTAVAWLRAAADGTARTDGLATVIDRAPELARVRRRPDVVALRDALVSGRA
jgi:Zn-dependent protease